MPRGTGSGTSSASRISIAPTTGHLADHHKLVEDAKPADVLTVAEALKVTGELQDVGRDHVPAPARVRDARAREHPPLRGDRPRARDHAEARGGGDRDRRQRLSPQGREARQILDEAETKILEIGEKGGRSSESFAKMAQILAEVMTRLDELHKNPRP
jgi:replicative DNA helicase